MTTRTLTNDERGKDVVDADGRRVGIVSGVRGDTAYVDPNPDVTDRIETMLGLEEVGQGDYPIDPALIDRVSDGEIHLTCEM